MKRLGIATKLTLIFVLIILAVLAGLGIPAYTSARAALTTATYSELLTTALEKQAALNSWVAERQQNITDIANQASIIESVTAILAEVPGSSEAASAHADLVSNLENWAGTGHSFPSMEVIDATSGKVIASTIANDGGKFRDGQPFFTNGLKATYIQNLYYDLSLQKISMVGSAPILSPDGWVVAVLAGRLNMDEMNSIIQRRSGLHQSDDAFMVNTSNLFVTQPRLIPDPAVLQRGIHTVAVNACLAHVSGVISAMDYRNVPALIVYRWLPERQLCLIVKIDQSEALRPANSLASGMAVIGILVLIIGSIAAYGMSRSITRPVRNLVHGAEQISQGNLDTRIEIRTRDELGKLGTAFNEMAVAIGEKETQLHQAATVLEQRVEERTQELRESEERYRILSETSPDMIFVIDREDKVQYVNKLAASQFGKTPEQVIGKARTELFPPGVAEGQLFGLQQVLKSAEPFSSESQIAFQAGSIWLETQLVPMLDEAGKVGSVMGVSRNITERIRAEEEASFLASIIQASKDAIIGKTLDGIIISWNQGAEKMYGYTANEIKGRNVSILAAPDRTDEIPQLIEEIKHDVLIRHLDTVRMRKNRTLIDISIALSPIKDATGKITGIATIARDITERKLAEGRLNKAMDDLARSNTELERFAYVASHDLQEPLRMVTSYLQLLERRYKDKLDGDALEFINYAVDGSNRMKTLINDLLAYSRVGTRGKVFTLTDCEEILVNVLNTLQISIKESKGKVTHDPLPKVMADDTQLESLFQNLIGNAIKFHGKKIPRIHVGVKKDGKNWVFSVSDNGIGIDPQFFERIFIIFQRLHNREEYPGTGIGLAISKRIVERHGGRIWIESQPNKGSTFFFTLPFQGEDQ